MKKMILPILIFLAISIIVLAFAYYQNYQVSKNINQQLFLASSVPSLAPEGFYIGTISRFQGKWLGKKFDSQKSMGINIFNDDGKQAERYPFKTYAGKSFQNPQLEVLKLDYNLSQNPLWSRFILDEIVQTKPGRFLGKLYLNIPFLPIALGFFHLEDQNPPKAVKQADYQIVMIGDSMTGALGNSDELQAYLTKVYPGKTFLFLNYGYGSTNILSVPDRLEKWTKFGRDFQPILDINADLILLESFGHNPLSEFPLQEGLKKQTETLDQIVSKIREKRPNAKLVFVATISPNKQNFAQGKVDLSLTQRQQWVNERVTYIKNHIDYAKSHNIPVIDIFSKSLMENGDGNPVYINSSDNIHPSPTGVIFISQQIADFIFKNQLLLVN